MTIYHYVYRISNIIINKHYYGKRKTQLNPTKDLGVKYFSSSKDLNFKLDQKENPNNYKYKIIKIFSDSVSAVNYEIMLHNKFDVARSPKFYNRSKQTSKKFDTTGMIGLRDELGNKYFVSINDSRYLSGELFHSKKGKTNLKNKNNEKFYLDTNDPRYLSGELFGISKGTTIVKNKNGDRFSVSVNDPRYLSGELVGMTKNQILVQENGINFYINKDDPRYLSGELKFLKRGWCLPGRIFNEDHKKKLSDAAKGIPKNRKAIEKMLKTKQENKIGIGCNHPKFKYYYVTPMGIFDSPTALDPIISMSRMKQWCVYNNQNKISQKSFNKSDYLKLNYKFEMIKDKTYKDIGFYHITKEEFKFLDQI